MGSWKTSASMSGVHADSPPPFLFHKAETMGKKKKFYFVLVTVFLKTRLKIHL